MGIAAISRTLTALLGLFIVRFIANALGPDGYGAYTTIFSYLFIFSVLADFGLYTLFLREVSRPHAQESHVASNFFTIRLFLVSTFLIAAVVIIRFIPQYPDSVKNGVLILGFFTLFASLTQILTGIFQKYLRYYYISISDVFAKLIQLTIVFLSIRAGFGLFAFLLAVVISSGLHFGFLFKMAQRFIHTVLMVDIRFWKKTLHTAVPVAISLVFTIIYFRIDVIVLSIMRPQADVGIYGIASKIMELTLFFPALFMGLIMPALSKFAVFSREKFRALFQKSLRVLVISGVFAVIMITALAHQWILLVSSSEFISAVLPLQLLAVAMGLIFLGQLGGYAVVALDLQKSAVWIYVLGAIFNTVTNIIFIPLYTYNAAAATTILTELFVVVALYVLIYKKSGHSPRFGFTVRLIIPALATFFAAYYLRNAFILIPIILSAIAFGGLSLLFRLVTPKMLTEW